MVKGEHLTAEFLAVSIYLHSCYQYICMNHAKLSIDEPATYSTHP